MVKIDDKHLDTLSSKIKTVWTTFLYRAPFKTGLFVVYHR